MGSGVDTLLHDFWLVFLGELVNSKIKKNGKNDSYRATKADQRN